MDRVTANEADVREWFCREVLPFEAALLRYIRHNSRTSEDGPDLVHDVYEMVIAGARNGIPLNTKAYVFTVARNMLINRAKRQRIVSIELVADLETLPEQDRAFDAVRQLDARDALRQVQAGLERLSPRVREIVKLRKIYGLDVVETSARLGISKDAVNHQLSTGMKALADFMLGGSGKAVRKRYDRRARKEGEV
nr:RNA polymerase sigma factor [Sphingobium lactosutens]